MAKRDLILEIRANDLTAAGVKSATASIRALASEAVAASAAIARASVPTDLGEAFRKRLSSRLNAIREAQAREINLVRSHEEAVKYLREQLGGDAGIAALRRGMNARQQVLLAALRREEADLVAHQTKLQSLLGTAPAGPSILARQAAVANRDPINQMRRDTKARMIGDMRSAGLRGRLEEDVRAELFGVPARERAMGEDTGMYHGPAVRPRFDAFQQEVRNGIAQRIKIMREEARRAKVKEAVESALFGGALPDEGGGGGGGADKGGIFDRLKGFFGARGTLKEIAEPLLKGGGIAAGATFAAMAIRDLAKSVADLRAEYRSGAITAGEYHERLLQSVPVFGQIRQAGLAIRELFTGEEAAASETMRSAQSLDMQRTLRERFAAAARQQGRQISEETTGYQTRARLARMGPYGRTREEIVAQQAAERRKLGVDREDAMERLRELDRQIAPLREQLAADRRLASWSPGATVGQPTIRGVLDNAQAMRDKDAALGRIPGTQQTIARLVAQRQAMVNQIGEGDTRPGALADAQKAELAEVERQQKEWRRENIERWVQHGKETAAAMFGEMRSRAADFFTGIAGNARLLLSERISAMRAGGNERGAVTAEIGSQFADRRRDLMGVAFGLNATAEQRAVALRRLRTLPIQQRIAELQALGSGGAVLPNAVDRGGVNTLALAARERRDEDPQIRVLRQQLKEAEKQGEKLANIATTLGNLIQGMQRGIVAKYVAGTGQ